MISIIQPSSFQRISSRRSIGFLSLFLQSSQIVLGQATSDQLSSVNSEFDSLSLSASYPDGFGIPLKAQAILNVAYPSGVIAPAKNYSASAVSTQPTITIIPSDANNFKAPNAFTLMLADANALGNPDKDGNYRHFLQNGATFGDAGNDGAMALNAGSGTVVTAYAGPGPLLNTGPHRYAWLLFAQPSSFHAPSNLSAANTAPSHWYVNSYVSSTGLGDLVAASFFIVENGHATFNKTTTATNRNNSTSSSQSTTLSNSNSTRNSASQNSGSNGPVWTRCGELAQVAFFGLGVTLSLFV